jgi:hypothetical protein
MLFAVMRSFPFRRAGAASVAFVSAALALSSCSEAVNDSVGRACSVIVGCGVNISVGDCVDLLGGEPQDCTYCIENSRCEDYSSCQREPVGCRIPPQLLPE